MRRRTFLSTGCAVALGTLAGCVGDDDDDAGDVPEPVDLSGEKFDYQGGMQIGPHGGPNGQIFYKENTPESAQGAGSEEHETLAWFHTLQQGLFPYHLERLDQGWEAEVVYVTDYSTVDVSIPEDVENPQLPSPTDPETFADATGLTFVADSKARGGMGSDLFPFGDTDEAETFATDYDGETVSYDDIDRQLLESL